MNLRPIVHIDDDDQILCRSEPGYMAVEIMPAGRQRLRQSLTLTGGVGRMRRLRAALSALLAMHDLEGDADDADDADRVPTAKYAARAWARDCGNCEPGAVVAAEAATGGALDYDDLLGSAMAAAFEPRGEDFDDPSDAEIAAGVRNAPKGGF